MAKIVSTWFGTGLVPFAPGTIGSIATLPVFILLFCTFGSSYIFWASCLLTMILFAMSLPMVMLYQKENKFCDHKSIVIDEVIGMMVALDIVLFNFSERLLQCNWSERAIIFFVIFVIFRFFDILKPLGIKTIDARLKNAFGVMLDDIIAGAYTGITIIIFYNFMQ